MEKNYIFEIIRDTILEILDEVEESDITKDNSLHNLGANSIDRMDIIMDVCDKLNVKIPLKDFSEIKNLSEMTELFYDRLS